jgi:hypothetical protein
MDWSQTIDSMFASTWAYRQPGAVEQAFQSTPFIYWLKEKGHVDSISGHRRIEIALDYGSNDTVRGLTKGKTVPVTDSELLTMAYEDWKYVSVSIMRWFTDDQKNKGKAAAINYVQSKIKAAERGLYEELERVMFADGSGVDEPNGIQNLISATPATGTVHGLNRATYSWFRNQQKTSTGVAALYLVSDMRTCLNNIIVYDKTNVKDIAIVTNQTVYELYEDVCMDLKLLSNTMMADAGFDTIVFKGKPIMWCPSAPSGNMYFINTAHYKLKIDNDAFMEMTNWKEIPNQPFDKAAQIVCTLNAVCDRPVVNSVLTGISAT